MKSSGLIALLLFAGASLAGCSAGGTSPSQIGAAPERPSLFVGLHAAIRHPDHRKSWRSARLDGTPGARMLFVSDFGTNDVYIFAIPAMTLQATLTGFDGPQGLCSDTAGDVWVTNTFTSQIFEYSHAGTLINTLSDPTGYPVGCAWNRRTGDLAVTNRFNFGTGQPAGAVLIYPGGTGTPSSFSDPDIDYYYFVAYDSRGNLYVNGTGASPSYPFALGVMPENAGSFSTMSIGGGTIYVPGGLQWDNALKDLIVGDQECGGNAFSEVSCTYSVAVTGLSGAITGSTALQNLMGAQACDVAQAVRIGVRTYGSDMEFASGPYGACASGGTGPTATYRWLFPGGGLPTGITMNAQLQPVGAAVSN